MSAVDHHLANQVDRIFNCGAPTSLGLCVLPPGHYDRCQAMPPIVPLCRICRGRGQVPGLTSMCWDCQGTGVAS